MECKTLVRFYQDVIQSRAGHQSVSSHAYISVDLTNEKGVLEVDELRTPRTRKTLPIAL